jgi:hypothetical protein
MWILVQASPGIEQDPVSKLTNVNEGLGGSQERWRQFLPFVYLIAMKKKVTSWA